MSTSMRAKPQLFGTLQRRLEEMHLRGFSVLDVPSVRDRIFSYGLVARHPRSPLHVTLNRHHPAYRELRGPWPR
ncbi:MAG TPA: hypothetical protein VMD91_06420 [Candidatus Sulfotelmatobacter sp.]|nr:hypothetical protein [Candidatus Sulfotelmatobacter sp.]